MNQIAIIMTCHNRKSTTLTCLENLFKLRQDIDLYCVDDASTDGTADAIESQFPQVDLIHGDGSLFWCRGMNHAWKIARSRYDYSYYIWLNDDLELYKCAFDEIFDCSKLNQDKAIISGIVQGRQSKKTVYGGYDEKKKIINPDGEMKPIRNLNGNFVLIPRYVFEKVGFFDVVYHHDIGDVDYGLTAQEKGIPVLSTRCFIGVTDETLKQKGTRIRKDGVNIVQRFKILNSPLGSPVSIHYHFFVKHYGCFKAIIYVSYLIFINIIPDKIYHILFKYK